MTERNSIIKFRERSHRPNGVSRFARILKGKVRKHFAEVFIGLCMWKACKLCKRSVFLYFLGPAWLMRFHGRTLIHGSLHVCWLQKQWKLKAKPCCNFFACKEISCKWMLVSLITPVLLVSYCLTFAVLWLVRPNKIVIWNCNFTPNPSERLAGGVCHLLECTTSGSLIW